MRVIESKRTNDVRIRSYQIETFVLKKQLYANLDEVKKKIVRKIIGNAWRKVLKEKKKQHWLYKSHHPSILRTPQGENEKHINDVRKAKIKAVHE